jgi:hypothetical protein
VKYISRRDHARSWTHGWTVSLRMLGRTKLFSDLKYGGRNPALKAAIAWRDGELAAAGIPLSARLVVPGATRSLNGMSGTTAGAATTSLATRLRPGARSAATFAYPQTRGRRGGS